MSVPRTLLPKLVSLLSMRGREQTFWHASIGQFSVTLNQWPHFTVSKTRLISLRSRSLSGALSGERAVREKLAGGIEREREAASSAAREARE